MKENIKRLIEKGKYTQEELKELIPSGPLNNVQKKKIVSNFKDGTTIKKGSTMQVLYGCDTCPYQKEEFRDRCPHNGRHANGGCGERYRKIAFYLKQGLGDRIPLMEEEIAELKFEAHNLKIRDMSQYGVISNKWIILKKIIGDLEVRLQRAVAGTTIRIEKDVTYKDIRKKIVHVMDKEGREMIIEKKEDDKGEHN